MVFHKAFLAAALWLFSMATFAVELELIPGGLPPAQKTAFTKERAALVAEKKALDSKVSRYNRQCAKPAAHQVHKCNVDRLALFQQMDGYKLKVQSFNKRLAAADQGQDKPKQGAAE